MGNIAITVYGAEQKCASCVNLPSAKETYEWLQAAIERKYDSEQINFTYVDIDETQNNPEYQAFTQKIIDEEYFYPLVVLNGEVVGEGNPKLKSIYHAIESNGLSPDK
ncbi:YuzD family protein [Pontibacillus yanchengensis]|uniref:Disulfide oxidoreductase n=1 Tax=Pontibacillus yanchengensis Y32 TaxID=1385514 RepID=A0A0A2TP80_9BACI|nr:YuzD family protein [Pontibacillus yanchengensis]KGP71155.1 disulfide oxidoreductase [Pontibacillus yanchengensis Y32]